MMAAAIGALLVAPTDAQPIAAIARGKCRQVG
jgi:hypothetical protein